MLFSILSPSNWFFHPLFNNYPLHTTPNSGPSPFTMSTLPNYVFGLQGLLLLANGAYTLLYPKKAAEPGSPMAETSVPVIHAMR